jgi:hypothetical protein
MVHHWYQQDLHRQQILSPVSTTKATNFAISTAGGVDTDGKFATCINDSSGKFATSGVNDTSGTGGKMEIFATGVNYTGGAP